MPAHSRSRRISVRKICARFSRPAGGVYSNLGFAVRNCGRSRQNSRPGRGRNKVEQTRRQPRGGKNARDGRQEVGTAVHTTGPSRSEGRRLGKEWVGTC